MPENRREPGRDRGAIPPPHEMLAYIENDLVAEFPTLTRAQIQTALETSRVEIAPSVDTQDLARRARQRLRGLISQGKSVPPAQPLSAQPLTPPAQARAGQLHRNIPGPAMNSGS